MSILNIAYSGLSAFQRALEVTGNNISNAATRGYSRQSVLMGSAPTLRYGNSYIGNGVNVSSIYRNADQFATAQVRNSGSTKAQYDTFFQQAIQVDKLLSQDGNSISKSLQGFFDAFSQLNNNPESMVSRGVALSQSTLLVDQFRSLQTRLDEYQQNSTAQLSQSVVQMNQLAKNVAELNNQLLATPNSPELMDNRDEMLKQLAEFADLTVLDQNDGTVSVAIANGQMLVVGREQRDLSVRPGSATDSGSKIFISNGAGQVDISTFFKSGKIGGLMSYENTVIGQSSRMIGQMAIGLSQRFNQQHKLGIDLNNAIGTDFFTDFNAPALQQNRSVPFSSNTGTGVLSVAISDIAQTQLSDYDLVVSDVGSNQLRLIRKSDGVTTNLTWSSSPPAPPAGQVVIDGMTISVDNLANLANGDQFSIAPTRGAAGDLALNITDARQIALASPVKTSAALTNQGTGQIALDQVFATSAVAKEYRLDFISETQYNLVNVTDSITTGPNAFTPNTENNIQIPDALNPSYSIIVSGIPKTGDTFTANFNAGGSGDNRNGLSLAGLQKESFFSNGSETLFDRYSNLLAQVGSQTNQARIRADSADILFNQAVDYQSSASGVNMDEEGANLLRFKQAYEAAGKLMEVSSQIMNMLFEIMR